MSRFSVRSPSGVAESAKMTSFNPRLEYSASAREWSSLMRIYACASFSIAGASPHKTK